MCHRVSYPISRPMLGITNDPSALTNLYIYIGMSMFNNVMRYIHMLHIDLQGAKSVYRLHLAFVCSRIASFASQVPTCYVESHNVINHSLPKIITYYSDP